MEPSHPTASRWRLAGGHTLIELLVAVAMTGLLAAAIAPSSRILEGWALNRAAAIVEGQLSTARLRSIASRRPVRIVRVGGAGLATLDASGGALARRELGVGRLGGVDSVVVRPPTIRYNGRGQGSAGSVYLYRGRRGVRVISNFVGRVRRQGFRF